MNKKIMFGMAIFLIIIIILFFVFKRNNDTGPPPPQPPPPPPPGPNPTHPSSEFNGNYTIIYPYDKINNLNINNVAPFFNLTLNTLTNHNVIKDDIGSKIGKDSFPILKCSINNKYVSVVFPFDPINLIFIDFTKYTLNFEDTFYVNMPHPSLPPNNLVGSLFFDTTNYVLSAVLRAQGPNGLLIVANIKDGKFFFEIPENSYETNIVVNNYEYQPQRQPPLIEYNIKLPDPASLQLNNESSQGIILRNNTPIAYQPYDPNEKFFLIQSKNPDNTKNWKILYLAIDNTYSQFLTYSDATTTGTPFVVITNNLTNALYFDNFYYMDNKTKALFLTQGIESAKTVFGLPILGDVWCVYQRYSQIAISMFRCFFYFTLVY